MPEEIRSLFVVLFLAAPAFVISRRISFDDASEFPLWKMSWFVVTTAAFLIVNYFVFTLVVTIICIYLHSKHVFVIPFFFLLVLAVPCVPVTVGGLGIINQLLEMNTARWLALSLLLPALLTGARADSPYRTSFISADWLIIGYVVLLVALETRKSEMTNVMRAATVYALDIIVPYFAFSRVIARIADLRKVLLTFVIAVLPLSSIAVFESAKGWLIYKIIIDHWGDVTKISPYITREGVLRASASADGPIVLGFAIMVAIGCMLAVRRAGVAQKWFFASTSLLVLGSMATLSRGPWVGIVALFATYLASGPRAVYGLVKVGAIGALGLALLMMTPVGGMVIDMLPFIGSVDAQNVTYRQQLFDNSLLVIQRNLFFGSTDYMSAPEMQELLQGQGIIDVVNTYIRVTLNAGLVGLGFFVVLFSSIMLGLRRVSKIKISGDGNYEIVLCARCLMAILVGILTTIATVSSVDFIPYIYWCFAGVGVSLIRIAPKHLSGAARLGPRYNRSITENAAEH